MSGRAASVASAGHLRLVRLAGQMLAGTFAVVGAIFLVIPGEVLAAFNWLSRGVGFPESLTGGFGFYLALAVAYMYVVMLLAWMIARHPADRTYAWLLVNAKAASSLLSLLLFAADEQYLIYLANFAVDGAIALFVAWLCLRRPS